MESFGYRVLGIILIISGISIWHNPIFHSRNYLMTFDFTEIRIPMSMFFVIMGSLFFWSTFRKK